MTRANEDLIGGIRQALAAWARAHAGRAATVDHVHSLGGHSGVTVGFDLTAADGTASYVLKALPPGVPARSNFDLLRQVPLLKVLNANQVPAPVPVSWSNDSEIFGSPYLITTRLPGAPFADIFVEKVTLRNAGEIFFDAVDRLAQIHAINAKEMLKDWDKPRPVFAEIDHWISVLRKSSDAAWISAGLALAETLRSQAPQQDSVGLVHGDYYSNNWLSDGGRLTGIVDWEGTSLGPSLLDLGWLCMIYDPASWVEDRGGLDWAPPAEAMIARYAQSSGMDVSQIGWYRALAGYRLACLTAYYFELHRTGKRHNPAWNVFARSFTRMVDRAHGLLATK
jgi:aminoglycoside phosphotransferase (APT) family kinase protein